MRNVRNGAMTLSRLASEEIKNMSFEDIFLSSDYKNDLRDMMHTACLRVGYKKAVSLNVFQDLQNKDIAYTDGNTVFLNLGMKFASRLRNKPVLFHTFVVGLIAHELGHIFWTDFDDGQIYLDHIMKGKIYPSVPNHPNSEKFVNALKDSKANRRLFCDILHSLDNILEDIYVNALQAEMLGGLYSKGITIGNVLTVEEMTPISAQKEKGYYNFNIILNCLITKLKAGTVVYAQHEEFRNVVENIATIADKYIFLKTHKERVEGINLIVCELWDYIEEMLSDMKQQASQSGGSGSNNSETDGDSKTTPPQSEDSNDSSQNKSSSNQMSTDNGSTSSDGSEDGDESVSSVSGDYSEEDGSKQSNNSEKKGSNNGGNNSAKDGSAKNGNEQDGKDTTGGLSDKDIDSKKLQEIIKRVLEQLQGKTKESTNLQTSPLAGTKTASQPEQTPQNRLTVDDAERFPMSAGEAIMAEGENVTEKLEYSPEENQAVRSLEEIVKNLSLKQAEKRNNEIVTKSMTSEVEDIDYGDIHSGINKRLFLMKSTSASKIEYELILKEILPLVEKLVKVIKRTIKEENLAGERRGRYFGKMLDNQRLYRPDLKVWKDRKNPKKEVDTAFSLLIDVSGSMSGTKLNTSRVVAILFAEACHRLNIPLEITGHTTYPSGHGIDLYNFMSFDSLNKDDRYSIPLMKAQWCNRDGAALIYSLERLKKRREKKKVFCIISDGQPNDTGYRGEAAKSDMKHIKNRYAKEGITFVAAAIDSDKEFIKEIYGRNFLNISYLESMPQTFGKILQNAALE